jgi:photosystem II stability/assembly factor-like uncharacterized protein
MKNLYVILFIVINILSTTSNAQWVKLNTDSVHTYSKVYFLNNDTGFVIGNYYPYQTIILRTLNGGNSWDTTKFGNYPTMLCDIYFLNDSVGYTGGQDAELFKTIDMGNTWTHLGSCYSPYDFSNFYFLSSDTAIIQGFGGDLRWYAPFTSLYCMPYQYTQTSNAFPGTGALDFLDDHNGYVAGGQGKFFRTFDRGATWMPYNADSSIYIYGAKMTNHNHAVVVGKNGKYSVTNDGGLNWSFPASISQHPILDVDFYNSQYGIAVGGCGSEYPCPLMPKGIIWNTSDGGNTWTLVDSSYNDQLTDIHIVNDSLAFAVGLSGLVLRNTSHFNTINNIQENNSNINFSVFPNPFSEEINIYFPSALSESQITLFDVSSKLIFAHQFKGSNYKINASNLSKGIYFIKIISDNGVATRKLVKVE